MHLRMVSLAAVVLVAACDREPPVRQYELTGQILAVDTARNEVLIKHDNIRNFMPAMTMPFTVKDPSLLSGREPGDLVTATLVVGETSAHLSSLTRTGHAKLETPPVVSDAPRVLMPGEPVADALLVDQQEKARPFSSFKGHRVAITFMFTRCPLPDFCPLMDRHFAAVQQTIQGAADMRDVRLISMTLDPEFDTPAVLSRHAARLNADPAVWSFVTGEPKAAADFARQFGIYTERDLGTGANLVHNLRTAIVDADGRMVKVHSGNDWTPADLVADLKATPAPAH
ncbi:MAG TPA: SCO family protein [Vicinamibacterales bacterium]|nr:SCO family protein [Vicinamibacterales bacterium]